MFYLIGRFGASRGHSLQIAKIKSDFEDVQKFCKRDELTGLHSRRAFEDRVKEAFKIDGSMQHVVVLYISMDGFKNINDEHGFHAGDAVLIEVANRLLSLAREDDVIARVGNDEFAFFSNHGGNPEMFAYSILEKLKDDVLISGLKNKSIPVTVRVGYATLQSGLNEWGNVVGLMQLASKNAHTSGQSRVFFYHSTPDNALHFEYSKAWLSKALNTKNVLAAFQPIVDQEGRCFSVEALARINDIDTGSIIVAGAFIQAAEKYGIAHLVDMAVFENALLRLSKIKEQFLEYPSVFVNLSSGSFRNQEWLRSIPNLAIKYGINPSKIILEITERESLDLSGTLESINELRTCGIKFALDDFGSGYSSLMYLREFAPDFVKIEGTLVQDVFHDDDAKTLVGTITAIAGHFNAEVVAEFVESKEVSDIITSMGIEYQQGHYHGWPTLESVEV